MDEVNGSRRLGVAGCLGFSMLVALASAACSGADGQHSATTGSAGTIGTAGVLGQPAAAGANPQPIAGAPSAGTFVGSAGTGIQASGMQPSAAGLGGHAGTVAGSAASAAAAGASGASQAGSSGAAGANAGASGTAGASSMPASADITSICMGGKVGMDSDSVKTSPLNVAREYGAVKYLAAASNQILSLKTTLLVPKTPTSQQTLFIWPGLQCQGASDPARIGNGILQPVLTWGPSCSPKAPSQSFGSWWMAAMYVNVSTAAAGPSGCAGGDYMVTPIGDLLAIEMSAKNNEWIQTITDVQSMKSVDFTIDLKGQVQNWATWAIEVPDGETIKPPEDVVFTQSVLTFSSPVKSCQPSQAGTKDYYSAPVLSADGLHCCYDKIILRM